MIGCGKKILFSSEMSACYEWNERIGELSCFCDIDLYGDFFIHCQCDNCDENLFEYSSHTALMQNVLCFINHLLLGFYAYFAKVDSMQYPNRFFHTECNFPRFESLVVNGRLFPPISFLLFFTEHYKANRHSLATPFFIELL